MQRKSNNLILFLIFVLALTLRLSGINHGLPYVFHSDEPTTVLSALGIRFNPNPDHFDWPHLYFYVNYFLYASLGYLRNFFNLVHLTSSLRNTLPVLWDDSVIFYLITRCLTALLGALTVAPLYFTGKRLFGKSAGLLAAFSFAVFPFQVWHAHYTMPDTAMLFLLACAVYYVSRILTEGDFSDYILAGFCFGLSASAKYNGGLGIFLIPLAHILSYRYSKLEAEPRRISQTFVNSIFLLFSSGFFSLLAFVIGTPYAALDYKTFLRTDGPKGALWQFHNVGSINLLNNLPLLFDRVFNKMGEDVGYAVIGAAAVCLLLVLYHLIRKNLSKYDLAALLLLIPCTVLLIYVSGYEKARSHYYFIVYPYLALIFGYVAYYVFSLFRKKDAFVGYILITAFLAQGIFQSTLTAVKFFNNDTRLAFSGWAKTHINPGAYVVYDAEDLKIVVKDIAKNSKIESKLLPGEVPDYYVSGEEKNPGSAFSLIYNLDNKYRFGPYITVFKNNP